MRYAIILAPSAAKQLRAVSAYLRAQVRDAIERHLRHEPAKVSKRRIKRLRGVNRPQYRLRVSDVRVFYDIKDEAVEVLAIVTREEASVWLQEHGTARETGSAGGGEG